jgi:hypothetical protein
MLEEAESLKYAIQLLASLLSVAAILLNLLRQKRKLRRCASKRLSFSEVQIVSETVRLVELPLNEVVNVVGNTPCLLCADRRNANLRTGNVQYSSLLLLCSCCRYKTHTAVKEFVLCHKCSCRVKESPSFRLTLKFHK